jgi:hypothetical protein
MGSHNARNTNIMGSCLFFILEHSIIFCSHLLWVQEDERRARIVNQVEKNMDAAGIEPATSR